MRGEVASGRGYNSQSDLRVHFGLGAATKVEKLEVRWPDGKVEDWAVEGGTPNTLQRRGITRTTVAVGTVIVVSGYQAKDGTLRANGRNITFPDGRTLFMGSSGTGAPKDGADATEPPR